MVYAFEWWFSLDVILAAALLAVDKEARNAYTGNVCLNTLFH